MVTNRWSDHKFRVILPYTHPLELKHKHMTAWCKSHVETHSWRVMGASHPKLGCVKVWSFDQESDATQFALTWS
jgi:hypothetical protein